MEIGRFRVCIFDIAGSLIRIINELEMILFAWKMRKNASIRNLKSHLIWPLLSDRIERAARMFDSCAQCENVARNVMLTV